MLILFIQNATMASITLTLNGNSSRLRAEYFPPIDLSDGEYVCGLVDFQTFNTIPNIDETNNLFHFHVDESMKRRIHSEELITLQRLHGDKIDKYLNKDGEEEEESVNTNLAKQMENNIIIKSTPKMISDAKFKLVEQRLLQSLTDELLGKLEVIQIPTGTYEVEHIANFLEKNLKNFDVKFDLSANKNTLKCEMYCSHPIDFSKANSIGSVLGFGLVPLEKNIKHESDLPANILKVNVIRIECDLIKGSYINNTPAHTIHEFSPRVPPGYKINEVPNKVIYFPVTVKSISTFNIALIDQNNRLINFRGETITVRVHIKRMK